MRDGEFLDEAVKWFQKNDIKLWGINKNPEQKEWTTSPKVYAHLYIDDSSLNCPMTHDTHLNFYVDWIEVKKWLEIRKII